MDLRVEIRGFPEITGQEITFPDFYPKITQMFRKWAEIALPELGKFTSEFQWHDLRMLGAKWGLHIAPLCLKGY